MTEIVEIPVSRIRQYVTAKAEKSAVDAQVADLETQVEDIERRNLRLTRELNEEVALRARSERRLKEETKKTDDLTKELEDARQNELPQPIKKPRKAPVKKRIIKAKPVDPTAAPILPVRQSSRKRGSVK